jgi:hypothetical protein
MLTDRFDAFEASANSCTELAHVAPGEEMALNVVVAEAILEFDDDLRTATRVVGRLMASAG